jgi:hypothetical protein
MAAIQRWAALLRSPRLWSRRRRARQALYAPVPSTLWMPETRFGRDLAFAGRGTTEELAGQEVLFGAARQGLLWTG